MTLDGDGSPGSVLTILPGVSVSLYSLVIQDGTGGPGASEQFGGGFTVGGGIDNAGSVFIRSITVTDNTASAGGGVYNEPTGAITTSGGSRVTQNTATDPNSGGGGIHMAGGSLIATEWSISGNVAAGHGGGVYIAGGTFSTKFVVSGNSPDNIFMP